MAKFLKRFWNRTCLPIQPLFRGCYRENLQLKPASYPPYARGFRFQFSLEPSLGLSKIFRSNDPFGETMPVGNRTITAPFDFLGILMGTK